ncbi:MAG: hypothetical protein C0180_04780 [Aciduliprofundum sp.]|nr:MAG: hypothetical protein C0180_04780 [Aciduliprofundum sp.]
MCIAMSSNLKKFSMKYYIHRMLISERMIREGTIKDFDIIKRIEKRLFGRFSYMDEEIREMLNSSITLIFDDKGYISFFFEDDSCHVESIGVLPGEKGKGIGRALMESMEKICRESGKKKVVLEVREKNFRAIAFYEKLGYRRVRLIENYYIIKYRGSRNAYLMEKYLS